MKAFLLAGGRGERLRPLTLSCPKCLVPIHGRPLLDIWLDHCAAEGITDMLLNVSHHAAQVERFLAARGAAPRVRLVVEAAPRGTAGTVADHRAFVEGEESFWVFYADNLTDVPLAPMRAAHDAHDWLLTIGLFHAPDPSAAGIVQMDARGRIVSFEEKPARPRGDLANAGIYLARAGLLTLLPRVPGALLDFGHHVLPRLAGRMYGHVIDGFLADVGTPASLARAADAWRARGGAAG